MSRPLLARVRANLGVAGQLRCITSWPVKRYATTMRFHVDACQPRQPQSKGKVERRVLDHRVGCDPYGRVFASLEDLQAWTDAGLEDRAGRRRCPATGTLVPEAWELERALLTPLPEILPAPFDVSVNRPVHGDGLVSFEGRQYSVPFRHIGKQIEVRGLVDKVQVLVGATVIATHPRRTERRLLIDDTHYEGEPP